MKTQLLIVSTAVFFGVLGNTYQGPILTPNEQTESTAVVTEFTTLRVHRQGKSGVTTVWAVNNINGITGFIIQRTYQDPADPYSYWEDVGSTPCYPARSFKYTDENVYPGLIHYRVAAVMADGSQVLSPYDGIRIMGH